MNGRDGIIELGVSFIKHVSRSNPYQTIVLISNTGNENVLDALTLYCYVC